MLLALKLGWKFTKFHHVKKKICISIREQYFTGGGENSPPFGEQVWKNNVGSSRVKKKLIKVFIGYEGKNGPP